jgi:hypothetical protein
MSLANGPEVTVEDDDDEEFHPVGTVTFLALYAVVLVVLWVAMYLVMLSRGSTS